jgi:PAT family beta-lactamase induction signal transducer AmpG
MEIGLKRRQMLIMFGMLYFVQGVIQAYQLNFFKPHMASEGIDPDRLGIVASLALVPFVIKWIFGIISDKWPLFGRGHRVPYMLIGLIGTSIAFAVAYTIDPSESFGILAAVVVTATFFMAFFDTATDALAVDAVAPEDYGTVQSWMTGGRAAGLIVVSFIFGLLADSVGYQSIFLVIAALLLIPLWFVNKVQEPATRTKTLQFDRTAFKILLTSRYVALGFVLILSWTFFQAIDGLVTFYMASELDADGSTIGLYGTLKGVGMVLGALAMPIVLRRVGVRNTMFVTLGSVAAGGLMFSNLRTLDTFLAVAVVWGIAVGFQWTVYASAAMGVTDLRVAGAMFAILATMSNIGLGVGDGLATAFTDNYSFSTIFQTVGSANLVLVPLILYVGSRFRTEWSHTAA